MGLVRVSCLDVLKGGVPVISGSHPSVRTKIVDFLTERREERVLSFPKEKVQSVLYLWTFILSEQMLFDAFEHGSPEPLSSSFRAVAGDVSALHSRSEEAGICFRGTNKEVSPLFLVQAEVGLTDGRRGLRGAGRTGLDGCSRIRVFHRTISAVLLRVSKRLGLIAQYETNDLLGSRGNRIGWFG